MLPYTIMICVVAILAGILHAHRHFAMPAAAPIVLNMFIIGSLCIGGWGLRIEPGSLVFVVAVAVLVAGLVQLFMKLGPLRTVGEHEVEIHLHTEVNVPITVVVEAEE
jgi:putative peptidoglycan lipid II flippase